jgi:hypothetical protein
VVGGRAELVAAAGERHTLRVDRTEEALRLYTAPSDRPSLAWSWVDEQLAAAGLYWVSPLVTEGWPHPRPVWGVWHDDRLHLSIGSPAIRRATAPGAQVTVHLESATDVVIVEGRLAAPTSDRPMVDRYDAKYDWTYDLDQYGPFTTVEPARILAWRTAGPAGRDSFQQTGRWTFGAAR